MKVTEQDLTLRDCSKQELIEIVKRITEAFGEPVQLFLDLELMRTDLLRMREAMREGK